MRIMVAVGIWWTMIVSLTGCSSSQPGGEIPLKTTPVSAQVFVDGEPALGLRVTFHPDPDTTELARSVETMSDQDGALVVGTYKRGDGLPAGRYYVTFKWMRSEGFGTQTQDKLKGLYRSQALDPTTSDTMIIVEDDVPLDLPPFELSTKPKSGKKE